MCAMYVCMPVCMCQAGSTLLACLSVSPLGIPSPLTVSTALCQLSFLGRHSGLDGHYDNRYPLTSGSYIPSPDHNYLGLGFTAQVRKRPQGLLLTSQALWQLLLRVELLGHLVSESSTTKVFSKMCVLFYTLLQSVRDPVTVHLCQYLLLLVFFKWKFHHSSKVCGESHLVSLCLLPIINHVEHLF